MAQRGNLPWADVPVRFVIGRYTASQTSLPGHLLPFLAPDMPRFATCSVCAFGRHEAQCVAAAELLGGDVRVGFENSLPLPNGRRAGSNAELVGTVATALRTLGLSLCDATSARERFNPSWSDI